MKKHADNDNAKKGLQKSQLPVSKNFYTCVTGRVSESLELIGRRDAVSETMDCIDRYMADGTVPTADMDATADEDEAGEAAPFVPRNRRERRLYEQELRRIARRQSRKKGFAYSGDF